MRHSARYRSVVVLSAAVAAAACDHRGDIKITGDAPSLQAARDALNEGEAGTSLAIARGVLAVQPNNVAALAQAGDAQVRLGDRLAADISYKRALTLSPHDVAARLGLGKLQVRDDLRGAEVTFRSILADNPRNALVLNDLGYVLDLQERHAAAQTEYRAAIAADPTRTASRVNLALSLSLSGQAASGEQMLRDLSQAASATPRVRVDFALAQVMAGHDKEAATTLGSDLTPEETTAAIAGIAQLRPALATAKQ